MSNQLALRTIEATRPGVVILTQRDSFEDTDWEAIASRALELGAARVVLVGPAPRWSPALPELIENSHWGEDFSRLASGFDQSTAAESRRLQERFASSKLLTYIPLYDGVCDATGCLAIVPGGAPWALMSFDDGHLTSEASDYVAREILAPILRADRR